MNDADVDNLIPPRKAPRAPAGLRRGGAARRLWAAIYSQFAMRPDEEAMFLNAVHTLDEIEAMRETLTKTEALMVRGGRGSVIAHPLLTEIRKHALVLQKLLEYLALSAADVDPRERSNAGRQLVNKRWERRRG